MIIKMEILSLLSFSIQRNEMFYEVKEHLIKKYPKKSLLLSLMFDIIFEGKC